ncbi:ABC transporter ATP-binding protein [Microbacterium sp. Root180]|uniref:ABC transporter ATP-binding protein n=1 Tax=Microbacterium sp. Root180 TaxID=1736483 RepID=UPI0006F757DF|nr:ABC transporter ATP-binding protein [Microbacterium sp. Root180]KRB37216.1 ABC transporter ATP-binding protein [Microbacterium sp. Root180]
MSAHEALLELKGLQLSITDQRTRRVVPILHDVTLEAHQGEVVAIVGESGSGKSMTTRSIMRLLPNGARTSGSIRFQGRELLTQSAKDQASFRASSVGMIYQDPRAHINSLWTVGDFLVEGVVSSGAMSRRDARARAVRQLGEVGIADGERRMLQYPYQLSGGLLQRVMIVAALMTDPDLIIADEATTALDVTVQADVMRVLRGLRDSRGVALLFITHDLDLASSVADTIVVMYAGRVVERGSARNVYESPTHPYTAALLRSRPNPTSRERLESIPGRPISAAEATTGCAFADRCQFAVDVCRTEVPPVRKVFESDVACHRAEEVHAQLGGAR